MPCVGGSDGSQCMASGIDGAGRRVRGDRVRRRAICAAACALPVGLRAAAPPRDDKVVRIGMLVPTPQQARAAALVKSLEPLGWEMGRNLRVESRVSDAPPLLDAHAAELARLGVD